MTQSAYIHIPFCSSKCKYCSFLSFVNTNKKEDYLSALLKDIDNYYEKEPLKTLYFGGGTPSLIEPIYLKKIIEKFRFEQNCEITLEMNPDDVNSDYLKKIFDIGINRLSMGSQTFNNDILSIIGRRHSAEQTIQAVEQAKKTGFKNISLDLIYGLPNQTIDILKKDLDIISNLGIQHISTYGLKIEENSFFYNNLPKNLPDDDEQADMYLEINDYLENKNYKRYEISNFAQAGYESKHNLNYWNNSEYYGFGAGSHGYKNGIRYSNLCSLEKYITTPTEHETEHFVTQEEKIQEEIFLGFRKSCGLNIKDFYKKFNIDFEKKYENIIKKYHPKFIKKEENNYKLTLDGVLLSNNILSDFI